jgi:imidazole glycerol-phosphate synthase subunit HisH
MQGWLFGSWRPTMRNSVAIIDYGAGNILNVARAFKKHGVRTELVTEPGALTQHTHIVLPGVGSFDYGMKNLEKRDLTDALRERAHAGVPILGICLGMQLLAQRGFENGETKGLGLIQGDIVHLGKSVDGTAGLRIPHTGWSPLTWKEAESHLGGSGLAAAYFNHSYVLSNPGDQEVVATTTVGSVEIPVAVRSASIFATQFHPEKSGELGLALLRQWLLSGTD